MRIKAVGAAFVLVGALALPAGPSDAQTNQTKKKQTVVYNRDRTIQISRDEDGRTRTRIIIQRRSFLDPGTESLPGDNVRNTGYIENPNQRAGSVIDNTRQASSTRNRRFQGPGPCRAGIIPGSDTETRTRPQAAFFVPDLDLPIA